MCCLLRRRCIVCLHVTPPPASPALSRQVQLCASCSVTGCVEPARCEMVSLITPLALIRGYGGGEAQHSAAVRQQH